MIGIQAGPDQIGRRCGGDGRRTRALCCFKQAGLREEFHPHDVSLGVKEVIALPEKTIEERFQCTPETGMAYTLVGHTSGIEGGGFLYTNKASLSLGVVVKIDSLYKSKMQPHQVLDEFKSHPLVTRLIEGGEVVEYSAQTVHRGGFHLMSQLYGERLRGDRKRCSPAAEQCYDPAWNGFRHGISAAAAAKAILAAREKAAIHAADLAAYETNLKQTSIYQDWQTFKDTYPLLENKRLFELYPDLACKVMEDLFSPTTQPGIRKLWRSAQRDERESVDADL